MNDLLEQARNTALTKLLREILEAVRELKPAQDENNALRCRALDAEHGAWLAGENANAWARERDGLKADVERLQARVAADTVTIATLMDENARLTSHAHRQELKRYREREVEHIQPLLRAILLSKHRVPADIHEAASAAEAVKVADV